MATAMRQRRRALNLVAVMLWRFLDAAHLAILYAIATRSSCWRVINAFLQPPSTYRSPLTWLCGASLGVLRSGVVAA